MIVGSLPVPQGPRFAAALHHRAHHELKQMQRRRIARSPGTFLCRVRLRKRREVESASHQPARHRA
jgi:hypothetical protein